MRFFFLSVYISSGYFPPKYIWNNIVKHSITERGQYYWTLNVNARPELSRFVIVQIEMKPNNLPLLSYIFPEYARDIIFVLKIAVLHNNVSKCDVCDNDVNDKILHTVMSCQHYLQERNSLFETIVSILPFELSVSFLNKVTVKFWHVS